MNCFDSKLLSLFFQQNTKPTKRDSRRKCLVPLVACVGRSRPPRIRYVAVGRDAAGFDRPTRRVGEPTVDVEHGRRARAHWMDAARQRRQRAELGAVGGDARPNMRRVDQCRLHLGCDNRGQLWSHAIPPLAQECHPGLHRRP